MKVVYRRSFIDVDDEEESPVPSIFRSRSAPSFARDHELQLDAETVQVNRDLAELAQRAQELLPVRACGCKSQASVEAGAATETATTATPSSSVLEGSDCGTPAFASDTCEDGTQVGSDDVDPAAPPSDSGSNCRQLEVGLNDADPTARFNCGSRGHPEVCAKPCIFFTVGKCENGDKCGYCHLRHQRRQPVPDRRQRAILRSLNREELFFTFLPLLRWQAQRGDFEEEAQNVLAMVEEAWQQLGGTCRTKLRQEDAEWLHVLLARLSFGSLFTMLLHNLGACAWVDLARAEMGQMRQLMPVRV